MENLTLINPGADTWTATVKLGETSIVLTVPIRGQLSLFADQVEHESTFQEIGQSTQYVRDDMPRGVTTAIEAPLLGCYLILGAIVAIHVFGFINPFKATGT